MGFKLKLVQGIHEPGPPVGGFKGDGRPGWKLPQNRQERCGVVGDVAVDQFFAAIVENRELASLAVDIHADVQCHCGPHFFHARLFLTSLRLVEQGGKARAHIVITSTETGTPSNHTLEESAFPSLKITHV